MKTGLHLIITLQPYKTTVAYTDCARVGVPVPKKVRVLLPSLFPHLKRHSPYLYFLPNVYPAVANKFNYNSLRASNYSKNGPIKASALFLNPCNIISR